MRPQHRPNAGPSVYKALTGSIAQEPAPIASSGAKIGRYLPGGLGDAGPDGSPVDRVRGGSKDLDRVRRKIGDRLLTARNARHYFD